MIIDDLEVFFVKFTILFVGREKFEHMVFIPILDKFWEILWDNQVAVVRLCSSDGCASVNKYPWRG